MQVETTLLGYLWHASFLVKGVMLILIGASLMSWSVIFYYWQSFQRTRRSVRRFLKTFWSTREVSGLYQHLIARRSLSAIEAIFVAGYKELRVCQTHVDEPQIGRIQRAMQIAQAQQCDALEHRLTLLATIGSTAPYIGLLGTVWGIMNALQSLGGSEQASIALVAPGISEALVTTALGLFVSIPAVIAYNRFSSRINRFFSQYETFQQEFIQIVCHQSKSDTAL